MKMMKRIAAFLCCVAFVLFCAVPSYAGFASADTSTGMRFAEGNNFEVKNALSQTPLSYEAEFKITKAELNSKQSYILGNYGNGSNHTGKASAIFSLRVNANGCPLIYLFERVTVNNYYITFGSVQVATGEKVHLAVTIDNDNFYCYVNGVLMQTVPRDAATNPVDHTFPVYNKLHIGNDLSSNDADRFRGELYSVALYKDCRSASEISNDYKNGTNYSDDGLMLAYDLNNLPSTATTFQDKSANLNHANKLASSNTWKWSTTPMYDPDDYAFSFMLVGDTQIVSKYSIMGLAQGKVQEGNTYMDMIYDYIVDNVETKKVKHVFGLGDVTEYNAKNEWEEAVRVTSKMNDVVPYSIVRGNHDLATNWFANSCLRDNASYASQEPYFVYDYTNGGEGSPKNGTVDTAKGDRYFQTYFGSGNEGYSKQYAYCYNNEPNNTIHFFTGSDNLEYMVVVMDYGPTDAMMNWASNIIKQYPNHNVIVTTHGYMWAEDKNNKYIEESDGGGMTGKYGLNGAAANCGDEMWEEFVSQHENIKMLFCGHVDYDTIVYRQDKGVNGNIVTQMLCDPQGIDIKNVGQPLIVKNGDNAYNRLVGMVATYYVSADGKTIDVEWYSPIQKAYYLEEGQFTFTTESTEFPRVVASVKGGNGTVSPERIEGDGKPVTITFAPNVGYVIEKVTLNGVDVTDQVSKNKLVITDVKGYNEVEVEYYLLGKYSLSVLNDDNKGTVDLSISPDEMHSLGQSAMFSVSPKGQYTVKSVKFNGHEISANNGVYGIEIYAVNNIIEVIYNDPINYYPFTVVNDDQKGTITPTTPFVQSYEKGEQLSFRITPASKYTVKSVKFNGHVVTATSGVYTVVVQAVDNILEVVYNDPVNYYSLTVVNDSSKGAITPTRPFAQSYRERELISFRISLNEGSVIKAVKFNGQTLTAENGIYSAKIVATDNILEVIYEETVETPVNPPVENPTNTGASTGCGAGSLSTILSSILFCALMLIKR